MKKQITTVIKAVLYIRVSTEEQAKHGYSLQAQKEGLIEYCKNKGYQIVDIYVDEGISARKKMNNRKELLRLLDDAKNKKFDRIVFIKLDRWFRSVADYYKVQEILERNGIDWETSQEDYNTTTSSGRLNLNIRLSIAQDEADRTSDRIKYTFDNMVKNGRVIYGKQCMPLGFMIVTDENGKKKMGKCVEEIAIVEDMFETFKCVQSIRKTLSIINKKYNKRFLYDSMTRWFRNTLYYGEYKGIENYCEPYITKKEFDEIQTLINKNVKSCRNRYDYIFSGLIKCKDCNTTMAGFILKTTKPSIGKSYSYPYYRCNKCYNSKLCKHTHTVCESALEKFLLENFENQLEKTIINISNTIERSQNVKVDVEAIKKKIDRLTDLYIDGKITREKYDDEFEKFNKIIDSSKKENIQKRDLSKYKKILNGTALSAYGLLNNVSKRAFWAKYIDFIYDLGNGDYEIHFK